MNLSNLTIKKARELLDTKQISAVELTQFFLNVIKEKNKTLNALLEVFDDCLEQAKRADLRIASGEKSPLLGIPFVAKDNFLFKGRVASSASKVLEGYVAPFTNTVGEKILESGAILLGRANMDEFAMGASTENSAFGVVANPFDNDRVSGGSSGGCAAAVSADMCLFAIGSDTGGSIRQPASFCGVVGFKPTYGATSRHGVMAMASSLDHMGPFTKTAEDAEIVFNVMKGVDPFDATTITVEEEAKPTKRIGVCKALLSKGGIEKSVIENFETSVLKLKQAGYEIVDVDLPYIDYSIPVYYIIVPAEVSSNMARYDGVKFGKKIDGKNLLEDYLLTRGELIGKEVRRRILIGTYVLSSGYYDSYYGKATKIRELIKQDFAKAFETVDAIIMPSTANPAFKIGEKSNDPIAMYLEDVFTAPADLAGIPAISVPSGKTEEGLPLGLQIITKHSSDLSTLLLAQDFEKLV